MANRQVRPVAGGLSESILHLIVAAGFVMLVYLLAELIADVTIILGRYLTG